MNIINKLFSRKLKSNILTQEQNIQLASLKRGTDIKKNVIWGLFDYNFHNIFSNYNVGDGIQTLAVKYQKEKFYPIEDEIFLNREEIYFYKKNILLIMQ